MHGVLPDPLLRCETCVVRRQAVCGAMNDEQLAWLNQIAKRRKLQAGETIMSDQARTAFFANVVSGTVKLTKSLPDGRQQIVGLLFPPDFLGRAYARNNPYFAEAATDVEICTFPFAAFEKLITEFPDLQSRLFSRTLDELDAAREWMVLLGRKTAEEKVASFLMLLARRSLLAHCEGEDKPQVARFDLPLTRADMADYLGLTIETVSRQLTRLKTRGLINLQNNRLVEVPDTHKLAQCAGLEAGI
jgi:CRP/FNR family transcriptional regulator